MKMIQPQSWNKNKFDKYFLADEVDVWPLFCSTIKAALFGLIIRSLEQITIFGKDKWTWSHKNAVYA